MKSPSAIFIDKNTGRYFCYSLIILSFKPGRSVFLLPCQRKATPSSSAEFFKHCACPSGYFVKAVMTFAWLRQSSSAAFPCPARNFSSVGKKLAEPFLPAFTSVVCIPPAAMLCSPAGRGRLGWWQLCF